MRPVMSYLGKVLLIVAVVLCAHAWCCTDVSADTLHLFVYNSNGWSTTIRYTNPTDAAVLLPGGLIVGGPGYIGETVAPHETSVQPTTGSTVIDVDVDPALVVKTEIVSPTGSRFRSDPLVARPLNYLYDLVSPGNGFNSGVVVIAATDSMVDVDGVDDVLKAGELRIYSNSGATSVVSNAWRVVVAPHPPAGDLYVLGYVNKWDNGSIFGVASR